MGDDVMSCEIDLFGSMYIAGRDLSCKHSVLALRNLLFFFGNSKLDYEELNDLRQNRSKSNPTPKMMTVYTKDLWHLANKRQAHGEGRRDGTNPTERHPCPVK